MKSVTLKEIKFRLLEEFGFSTTKELKALLVEMGKGNIDLRIKTNWTNLIGIQLKTEIRFAIRRKSQPTAQQIEDKKAAVAKIDAKREEIKATFKYRTAV